MYAHGLVSLEAHEVGFEVWIGHTASARKDDLDAAIAFTHGIAAVATKPRDALDKIASEIEVQLVLIAIYAFGDRQFVGQDAHHPHRFVDQTFTSRNSLTMV